MARVTPRLLLDTHIVIRWLYDSKRLSRDQLRAIDASVGRGEPLAVTASSLLEIAVTVRDGRPEIDEPLDRFLDSLDESPFQVLPLTPAAACEAVRLEFSRFGQDYEPRFDRAIAATARVCGLRLVTADQRIIDSNLVSTIG